MRLVRRARLQWIVRGKSVLGLLALSEGDPGGAAEELVEAARLLEQMGFAHPGALPILPDAIEALAGAATPSSQKRSENGSSGSRPRSTVPGHWQRSRVAAARC